MGQRLHEHLGSVLFSGIYFILNLFDETMKIGFLRFVEFAELVFNFLVSLLLVSTAFAFQCFAAGQGNILFTKRRAIGHRSDGMIANPKFRRIEKARHQLIELVNLVSIQIVLGDRNVT